MAKESVFLLLAAAGLIPIALSYGVVPSTSMAYLFDVDVTHVDGRHILRAVMGLYLAMVVFWVLGATVKSLRLPALCSLAVFMLGLAGGRVLSLVVDGMPSPLLVVYLCLEVGFGVVGMILIRRFGSA